MCFYVRSAWSPVYWAVRIPSVSLIGILFVLSLCLPCLAFEDQEVMYGNVLLFFGWAGVSVGHWAWFANLCWAVCLGLLLLGLDTVALALSVLTGLLAISALYTVPTAGSYSFPAMGGQKTHDFVGYEWGFWAWLAAMTAPMLVSTVLVVIRGLRAYIKRA